MFNKFETTIAFRYLRSRRKEGFISIIAGFSFLGIMLGVATLIVVMAVMNGFHQELLGRILGINAHISISHNSGSIKEYNRLGEHLSSLPNVIQTAPLIQGQVLASAGDKHVGSLVRGMKARDLKNKPLIADNIILGDFWDENDPQSLKNSVLIGTRMSRSMRLLPGDTIQLISPKTSSTFFGEMPRIKDYTVVGVFETGMFEYDSSTIFMPFEAAQLYFKFKDTASSIEILLRDQTLLEHTKAAITTRLNNDYYLTDWKAANSAFFSSLKVERNVMFMILALIIVIAAFNTISGMVMLVTSKSKEIAILRTIGASRAMVMRIFILCGAAIGVVGTFLGLALGIGFASNIETIRRWLEGFTGTDLFSAQIYFLSQLPADLQNADVYGVVALSLSLSLLATLYPAWRAARISPIEGIRNE